MTANRCDGCECWVPQVITIAADEEAKTPEWKQPTGRGECRRFPPAVVVVDDKGQSQSRFPMTMAAGGCWEWRRKPSPPREKTQAEIDAIQAYRPEPPVLLPPPEVHLSPEAP